MQMFWARFIDLIYMFSGTKKRKIIHFSAFLVLTYYTNNNKVEKIVINYDLMVYGREFKNQLHGN